MKLEYKIGEQFERKDEKQFYEKYAEEVEHIHNNLHNVSTQVNDYKGWVNYPEQLTKQFLDEITETAEEIRGKCTAFIVIGIGGSYLGAKAAIDLFEPPFYYERDIDVQEIPEIYFAGHHLSSVYYNHLLKKLKYEEVCVCFISKSGSTLEPSLIFELFKSFLYEKYGRVEAAKHIYAITDKNSGRLRREAEREGYKSFVIPENIGGRYSVLTPVGLLPIAVAGIDVYQIAEGAKRAQKLYRKADLAENCCYQYAALRYFLQEQGKVVEIFEVYEARMAGLTEWLKQLFGESECKEGKGVIPMSLQMTTDLHSMGQLLQDGRQIFFETAITVDRESEDISLEGIEAAGHVSSMHQMHSIICESALKAHSENGTPNIKISIEELTPKAFGEIIYFFEKSCAVSCMLTGVNPFDQPGVERYKANIKETIYSADRERC